MNRKKLFKAIISICLTVCLGLTSTISIIGENVSINTPTSNYLYLSDTQCDSSSVLPSFEYNILYHDTNGQHTSSGTANILYNESAVARKFSTYNEDWTQNDDINKGLYVELPSEIVFDMTNRQFNRLTGTVGIDAPSATERVKSDLALNRQLWAGTLYTTFKIYTSTDNINWTSVFESEPLNVFNQAAVDVDISGVNFIKLVATGDGLNASWMNMVAFSGEFKEGPDYLYPIEEYDGIIREKHEENASDLELWVLRKYIIERMGYQQFLDFYQDHPEIHDTLSWLFNDEYILKTYVLGGAPYSKNGAGYVQYDKTKYAEWDSAFLILDRLYKAYRDDFDDETPTSCNVYDRNDITVTRGDLYLRIAMSIALSHTFAIQDPFTLIKNADGSVNMTNSIDPVDRYATVKRMYLIGKFNNNVFERLTIEEMRFVVDSTLYEEEWEWMNDYFRGKAWWPYSFMAPVDARAQTMAGRYLNAANHNTESDAYKNADKKYNFSSYGIVPEKSSVGQWKIREWIVLTYGGACLQMSESSRRIYQVNGYPCLIGGQYKHATYLYYNVNQYGRGYWGQGFDLKGDLASYHNQVSTQAKYPMCDFDSHYRKAQTDEGESNYPFFYLAQEALNNFALYEQSTILRMMSHSFENNEKKEILEQSLEILPQNYKAWEEYIDLRIEMGLTSREAYNIIEGLSDALKYHPFPYFELTKILNDYTTTNFDKLNAYDLRKATLQIGANTPSSISMQSSQQRKFGTRALQRLGARPDSLATFDFSFNGVNANKIRLLDSSLSSWSYSLDGGNTFTVVENAREKLLSADELSQINENDNIVLRAESDGHEISVTIPIEKAQIPDVVANDLENAIFGLTDNLEWKYENDENWTSFADNTPNVNADATVLVRAATNHLTIQSEPTRLVFTDNDRNPARKYIRSEREEVINVSSDSPENDELGEYLIDGNYKTKWHTNHDGSDREMSFTVKLDHATRISAIELSSTPGYRYGIPKALTIWVSVDGENWNEVKSLDDLPNNDVKRVVDFDEPHETMYIKVQVTDSHDRTFASLSQIDIFENIVPIEEPTTEEPITEEPTTKAPETTTKAPETTTKADEPKKEKNCNCICHRAEKNFISRIFYKISLLFWRIFKTHKACSCGVQHY